MNDDANLPQRHRDSDLPERFENPGVPPHRHRMADVDQGAARRAERQVAAMFALSILGTLGFIVAYFVVDENARGVVPGIGEMNLYHLALGLTLALSLCGIGFGAVHWAKTLMPDTEIVEERHPQRSESETRDGAGGILTTGWHESQLGRRPLMKYTMGGALGLFALPLGLQAVGGLGPLPGNRLSTTMWEGGLRLVQDPTMVPIKASDVTIGSVYHVLPEGIEEVDEPLNAKAKASVILVRLDPQEIRSAKQRDWGFEGIVAYSKICTHVGCPVGLYEQQTHHLLCPCHQSTFDMTEDCKVIFGPAGRPLPQLPISVDDEGYLVAEDSFAAAVGPSYWGGG